MANSDAKTRVLVTGGAGFLGTQFVTLLVRNGGYEVTAADINVPSEDATNFVKGVSYEPCDIRDRNRVFEILGSQSFDAVVHLAAMVAEPPGWTREMLYDVDVNGTQHVLDACIEHKCPRVVITSSGAAYGYYEDNPDWLTEEHEVRGNAEFAYSHHKKLIEHMLADYREKAPQLSQVILRVGTILGYTVNNQITNLFHKPRVLGIRGSDSPFVFIWDSDLSEILRLALHRDQGGIFNVAGTGAVSMPEIARKMAKPYIALPAGLVKAALAIAHPLRLSRYGPEQVRFLQYRPVLDNRKLRTDFAYTPKYTSEQALDEYLAHKGLLAQS